MAETKAKKTGGGKTTGKDKQYIEHEHIETPAAETKTEEVVVEPEAEEVNPEKQIKLEVAKLNLADTAIAGLKEQYGALTINGVEDKAGYKAVKAAWSEVRSIRTGLEKRGLAIRNRIAQITKAVSKEEDRLIDLLTPLEEDLQKKYKAIDDEKVRVEKEAADKEQKRLMERLEELVGMGMKLVDGFYRIGETVSMDAATLRALPDEQYAKLKETVQAKNSELAENKRIKDEADEKERKRVEKEREDLENEKKALRSERREVRLGKLQALGMTLTGADAQEVISFQWIRLYTAPLLDMTSDEFSKVVATTSAEIKKFTDEEAAKKLRGERMEKVKGLRMVVKGDNFFYDNGFSTVTHGIESLISLDDYGFEEHLKILADQVKDADNAKALDQQEKEKEQKAVEEKKKFISATMDRAGLNFSYTAQEFYWEDKNKTIRLGWNALLPLTEPEISDKAASLVVEIETAKKFTKDQDDKKAKKDAEEKKAGLKDKERLDVDLLQLEADLGKLDPKPYTTKAYKDKINALRGGIEELIKTARK
jgi:hypothetical protein